MKKILFSLFVFGLFFGGSLYAGAVSPLETVVDEILSLRQGAVKGASVSTPILTTTEVTSITEQSALVWGNVSDSGGSTVTKRGIVWGVTLNPVIDNNLPYQQQEASTAGTGLFTARAYALSPDTTYHARAYAINSFGTAYGNDLTFKTAKVGSITAPIITTSSATNITATTATLGGDITSDGGATITERGIVWGTTTNPTTSSSGKSSDPSWAVGVFTKNITGLSSGTTYYARAYATNNRGTSYGNNVSFKTLTIVNGGWTAWANQGGCVSNLQTQVRTCTNPAPANGGAPCSGDATQKISCTPNPYIKVTYPNGGEVFTAGQPIEIKWTSNYIGSNELVNVYLYVPSKNWSQVVATRTPNDGSEIFYDSGFLDEYGKIFKVIVSPSSVAVVQDTSDDFFTINKVTVLPDLIVSDFSWTPVNPVATNTSTVITPDGYLNISVTIKNIGGSSITLPEEMRISLYKNDIGVGGLALGTAVIVLAPQATKTFTFISAAQPNVLEKAGIFDLTMKVDGNSPTYSINSDPDGLVVESNENNNTLTKKITINSSTSSTPSITVLSPNGGEAYTAGQQITVKWTSENITSGTSVSIAINPETGGGAIGSFIDVVSTNDKTETFTIPTAWSGKYKVFVRTDSLQGTIGDYSDATFTINSSTNPNPVSPCGSYGDVNGDGYISDNDVAMISQAIAKTTTLTADQIKRADVNADGVLTSTDTNYVRDYSSKTITTFPVCSAVSTITILSPNGGEIYTAGQSINITWTGSVPGVDDLNVILIDERAGPTVVSTIGTVSVSQGSLRWTIPTSFGGVAPLPGDGFKIVLRGKAFETESKSTFTINSPITDFSAATVSQCLKDKGAILYGASWCSHCQSQKQLFGNYINNISYVECSTPDGIGQTDTCKQSNIIGYPTWRFMDGTELTGEQSLEALYNKAGCGVPNPTGIRPQCSDGLDNDVDGTIDQGDVNCHYGLDLTKGYVANFTSESSSGLLSARTLRVGSRGSDVVSLQKYLGLKADGIFGRMTASAVREWQAKNGLVGDSIFGAKSFSKLMEEKMLMERSTIGQ